MVSKKYQRPQTVKYCTRGRLEVICGSMFSGKTEELMRRLKRYEFARKRVLTISHSIDTRRGKNKISSHDGGERIAVYISGNEEGMKKLLELSQECGDVIGIDEIQFFPKEIVQTIKELLNNGKDVVVSGLDLDFRGEPFGVVPNLMALADEVVKLKAICVVCAEEAHHTQRLVNGKPAKYSDPTVLVGASDCYEARCRNCFHIEEPSSLSFARGKLKTKRASTAFRAERLNRRNSATS